MPALSSRQNAPLPSKKYRAVLAVSREVYEKDLPLLELFAARNIFRQSPKMKGECLDPNTADSVDSMQRGITFPGMKQHRFMLMYFMKVMLSSDRRVSMAVKISQHLARECFRLSDSLLGRRDFTSFKHAEWYLSTSTNPLFSSLWHTSFTRLQTCKITPGNLLSDYRAKQIFTAWFIQGRLQNV